MTAEQVQTAATVIIEKNIFSNPLGLVALKDARIMDNTVNDLI
ncbi:DUF2922 family protein [Desulforamulus putei]